MKDQFDYIIIGSGCAGLSMALQLMHRLGPTKRVLLVDRLAKQVNDRSWAFWASDPLPLGLDQIVKHRWPEVRFVGENWEKSAPVAPYTYQFIESLDYYRYMRRELSAYPNITWKQAEAGVVGEDTSGAYLTIGHEKIYANWIFDSRVNPEVLKNRQPSEYFLWQHFRGWRIRTQQAVFSPQRATLMDFSCNTPENTAFFYVLPFSETEALVEYTIFSPTPLAQKTYDERLASYLQQLIPGAAYAICEEEHGQIPMTNLDLAVRKYRRIRSIGTAANAVKPTTGYAFLRIQERVREMVDQLATTGEISNEQPAYQRMNWYDDLLLNLLSNHPEKGKAVFSALFRSQPFPRILKFLDQNTHIGEEALIFKSLPITYFLGAAQRHFVASYLPRPKTKVNFYPSK